MKQRLFVTLSLAGLAMATFGATKPKTAIKSLNKTTIQQPTYTEWHDLQVNAINRFRCTPISSPIRQMTGFLRKTVRS